MGCGCSSNGAMALFQEWKTAVTRDPVLLAGAIKEGIHAGRVSRCIKPDQFAVKSLLKGEDMVVRVRKE